jgi:hypothetical protein
MASRQDEKDRRRRERLEREQAEQRAAARQSRMRLVFGGIAALVVAAVVVVVVLVAGGGGGDDGKGTSASTEVAIPAQKVTDLDAAAKAAGCTVLHAKYEGAGHDDKDFKPSDYKTNPPTSGAHNPVWYQDGVYAPGSTPKLGMLVHPLEHGRIEVQYKPGTPQRTVSQLETLLAQSDSGYHMLLFQNTTGMTAQVAATAWTQSLTCPQMNDGVFDAIRAFRTRYIDKGPEIVP